MKFWNWIVSFFRPKSEVGSAPIANPVPAPISVPSPTLNPVSIPGKWDGTSEVPGVDTAHYQDAMTTTDWSSLFAKGFRWMYPKAVDGVSGPDSYFTASKFDAKAAGFLCFAGYCFFRFDQDPIAQAEALVKVTGGVKSGELPCVIDCEWDNASKDPGYHDSDHGGTRQLIDGPGEEKLYACLCKVQELTGITPWLYGSTGFLIFKSPARFARFPFIVANYSAKIPDGKVPLPLPWVQETARQYSGSLTAGKAGEIDGDRFLGTLDQLKAYVKP